MTTTVTPRTITTTSSTFPSWGATPAPAAETVTETVYDITGAVTAVEPISGGCIVTLDGDVQYFTTGNLRFLEEGTNLFPQVGETVAVVADKGSRGYVQRRGD